MFVATFQVRVSEEKKYRVFRVMSMWKEEERARAWAKSQDKLDRACFLAINLPTWLPVIDTIVGTRWQKDGFKAKTGYLAISPHALPNQTSHLLGLYDTPETAEWRAKDGEVLEFSTYAALTPYSVPALIEARF